MISSATFSTFVTKAEGGCGYMLPCGGAMLCVEGGMLVSE